MPPMLKPKRRRAPGRTSRRRIRRPGRRGLLESAQSPIFFESFESVAGNVMSKRVYWILAIAGIAMLLSAAGRSEEHTSELQSLMRISYAVFCLKKKRKKHLTADIR